MAACAVILVFARGTLFPTWWSRTRRDDVVQCQCRPAALGGTVRSPPSFLAWARRTWAVIGPVPPSVHVAPVVAPPRGARPAPGRVFWRWLRRPRRWRVGGKIHEDRDIDEPVQQRDAGWRWWWACCRASRRLTGHLAGRWPRRGRSTRGRTALPRFGGRPDGGDRGG